MLYGAESSVCSEINKKHINSVCGQNVDSKVLNLLLHATSSLLEVKCRQLQEYKNIY